MLFTNPRNHFAPIIMAASLVCALSVAAHAQTSPNPSGTANAGSQAAAPRAPEPVRSWPEKAKRYALIIGVESYKDQRISSFESAGNDARALSDTLINQAGFSAERVYLLTADQPIPRQPMRSNILHSLLELSSIMPKDGLLVVAFVGHGMEQAGEAFLLPVDAQLGKDLTLLKETAIRATDFKDRIRKTGVGQVLMVLDAWRNKPAGNTQEDNRLSPAFARELDFGGPQPTASATVFATGPGQRAYQAGAKKQGYLASAFVEGMRQSAPKEQSGVTLAALVNYLQAQVPKQVAQDLGAGKVQQPFAKVIGYRADELVVAEAKAPVQTASSVSTGTGGVGIAPINVAGVWALDIKTPNGASMPATLTIQQEGETITGTVKTEMLGEAPLENAKLKGNDFTADVSFKTTYQQINTKVAGRVEQESMKGQINVDMPNFQPLPFTGTRNK